MENKELQTQTDLNISKLFGGLTEYQKRQQEILEDLE